MKRLLLAALLAIGPALPAQPKPIRTQRHVRPRRGANPTRCRAAVHAIEPRQNFGLILSNDQRLSTLSERISRNADLGADHRHHRLDAKPAVRDRRHCKQRRRDEYRLLPAWLDRLDLWAADRAWRRMVRFHDRLGDTANLRHFRRHDDRQHFGRIGLADRRGRKWGRRRFELERFCRIDGLNRTRLRNL